MFANLPFSRKEQRQLPPIVPTDEVIPVHLFDDSAAARRIVLVWTFKFADVLDPFKLHAALSHLFQMEGWRRFSGRFRYRVSKRKVARNRVPCLFTGCLFLVLIRVIGGRQFGNSRSECTYRGASSRAIQQRTP